MTERKKIIVGNWKMYKTPAEAQQFLTSFAHLFNQNKNQINDNMIFGLAVPAINLELLKKNQISPKMLIAAQDINQHLEGAYTGDLSANMVKAVGANAVIIGHSERREFHHETDADINGKIKTALQANLKPIMCIGETLKERKNNTWKAVLSKQIKAGLAKIAKQDLVKIVIAYEPIWAIGTGLSASADQAQEACAYVRKQVATLANNEVAEQILIQYGGSVKPENIEEILTKTDIDGALVGSASLTAESFIKLLI